jgi:hypothetical protein
MVTGFYVKLMRKEMSKTKMHMELSSFQVVMLIILLLTFEL